MLIPVVGVIFSVAVPVKVAATPLNPYLMVLPEVVKAPALMSAGFCAVDEPEDRRMILPARLPVPVTEVLIVPTVIAAPAVALLTPLEMKTSPPRAPELAVAALFRAEILPAVICPGETSAMEPAMPLAASALVVIVPLPEPMLTVPVLPVLTISTRPPLLP